tara:strand:- start:371 stop:628 length:258 start_codon:yes stop_codon:yes gene_type:complete
LDAFWQRLLHQQENYGVAPQQLVHRQKTLNASRPRNNVIDISRKLFENFQERVVLGLAFLGTRCKKEKGLLTVEGFSVAKAKLLN